MTTWWLVVGWIVAVATGGLAASIAVGWCPDSPVAMGQLLLPWWFGLTAVVTVVSAATSHLVLAVAGLSVAVVAAVVLWPKLHRSHRQDRRAAGDAVLTVVLANLYLDNPEPDDAIRQLLGTGADVLVMTELTPALVERFDALGGADRYPARVHREPLRGEYEAGIFARRPFRSSEVRRHGGLQVVDAVVGVDGDRDLRVVAVHPEAPVGREPFRRWRSQLADLRALLDGGEGPMIAVGDLNGGSLQPPYERLLGGRFRDAHDELGQALRPSWGVAPWLPRWVPTMLARLDHLLVSPEVSVVSLDDLDPIGSDHRPFVARLALP